MKKLLLVALVMMAGMICVSCSKDDDKDTKPMNYEEMIVGKWEVSYNSNRGLATDIITFKSIGKLFEAVWSETPYNGGKTYNGTYNGKSGYFRYTKGLLCGRPGNKNDSLFQGL